MSAPWTKEQAEKWAHEMAIENGWGSNSHEKHKVFEMGFLAGLAKAAEIIEASPTVYVRDTSNSVKFVLDGNVTHQAKLVNVRPIEGKT